MSEELFRAKYEPRLEEIKYGEIDAFIAEMMTDPLIDYGSVCLALGFAAAAAATAANRSPVNGGITGFQSGFVMWEFLRQWQPSMIGKSRTRIVNYDDMLYPQYEHKFAPTITAGCWAELQKLAQAKLDDLTDDLIASTVVDHWKSIVAGRVPFGYIIKGE